MVFSIEAKGDNFLSTKEESDDKRILSTREEEGDDKKVLCTRGEDDKRVLSTREEGVDIGLST